MMVFCVWGVQFVSLGFYCLDCGESYKGLLGVSDLVGDFCSNWCCLGVFFLMDRGSEYQEILDKKYLCVGNFYFYENFYLYKN